MELPQLIAALSQPAAYPHAVETVEVRQTHISAVFLAGPFVYKIKKPVDLGFLDFRSLQDRRRFCEQEVRLNRRLAPHVYLGVVPVLRSGGRVFFDGDAAKADAGAEVVDWAVKMQRLPDEATLFAKLEKQRAAHAAAGEVDARLIEKLAERIASFHRAAESNEQIAACGRFAAVERLLMDIFDQAAPLVGTTVSAGVFARVKALAGDALDRLRPLIEARAERGTPRDCHGDLHLDHVYHFPERAPPDDLVIIDCIEFNERFRCIDPVADMAFPHMDLLFHGRRDLARVFAAAYFRAAGDEEGRGLLPLYSAYRATVRGMVEGLELGEEEVSAAERSAALKRAHAHWLLALTELEEPAKRPCLVLVGGLPGTGKSSLAEALAAHGGFEVVRSDVVRKELAGLPAFQPAPPELREVLYAPEAVDRTYAECLTRAERLLFEGKRVVVDATFRAEEKRRTFVDAALAWGVPAVLLLCQAKAETVRRRLAQRHGNASDAGWDVYLQIARTWEEPGPFTRQFLHVVSMEESCQRAAVQAIEAVRQAGRLDHEPA